MYDTTALTIDPEAVRAWLRRPSDEDPEFTNAETHGIDEVTGRGEGDFLPTIRRVLADQPDGVHRRPDVTRVELWLIPDGEVLHQGAVITVDLANGIRLASLHQDVKDFADRDQRGVPALLSALDHIAAQVCLLLDQYQTTGPGNQAATPAPTNPQATAPSAAPAPVAFTRQEVSDAVNQAADDVLDAVDAGDSGLRDGLNLAVNATIAYLTGEADNLQRVVEQGYDATYDEVLSWIQEAV